MYIDLLFEIKQLNHPDKIFELTSAVRAHTLFKSGNAQVGILCITIYNWRYKEEIKFK